MPPCIMRTDFTGGDRTVRKPRNPLCRTHLEFQYWQASGQGTAPASGGVSAALLGVPVTRSSAPCTFV